MCAQTYLGVVHDAEGGTLQAGVRVAGVHLFDACGGCSFGDAHSDDVPVMHTTGAPETQGETYDGRSCALRSC